MNPVERKQKELLERQRLVAEEIRQLDGSIQTGQQQVLVQRHREKMRIRGEEELRPEESVLLHEQKPRQLRVHQKRDRNLFFLLSGLAISILTIVVMRIFK